MVSRAFPPSPAPLLLLPPCQSIYFLRHGQRMTENQARYPVQSHVPQKIGGTAARDWAADAACPALQSPLGPGPISGGLTGLQGSHKRQARRARHVASAITDDMPIQEPSACTSGCLLGRPHDGPTSPDQCLWPACGLTLSSLDFGSVNERDLLACLPLSDSEQQAIRQWASLRMQRPTREDVVQQWRAAGQ